MQTIWTPEQLDTLVREWPNHNAGYIAQLIEKSHRAVKHRAYKMNLVRKRPGNPIKWTPDRVEVLTTLWPTYATTREIAANFGVSQDAVIKKAAHLSLGKKPIKIVTSWTDEKTNRLKKLWPFPEWSIDAIGAEIGMTRGSISGKAARLQLPYRGTNYMRQQKKTKNTKGMRATLRAFELNQIASRADTITPLDIGLLELQPIHCRWVTGEADGLATYCGHHKVRHSYCSHHAGIAYRPMNTHMQRAA